MGRSLLLMGEYEDYNDDQAFYDMDDMGYGSGAGWTMVALSLICCMIPLCMCCFLANSECTYGRQRCFGLKKGEKAPVCQSGDCVDFGCGCNGKSCCCSPPGTAVVRKAIKAMTFWTALMTLVMLMWSFAAYKCDGAPRQPYGSVDDDSVVASHVKHSQGHLHLNRNAARRGHCLTLDAELAWSTKGLTTNENGATIPAAWSVERHTSAHATFGLAQWIPGYGEAIQPVSPVDACAPLQTEFKKGGVALIENGGPCTFFEKAKAAQHAGAEAVVIYDLPAASGHGEADCKSIYHHNNTYSAWCYTGPDACQDGTASDRFKGVEWSVQACSAPTEGCKCTEDTKDDFEEIRSSWGYYSYDYDDDGPNEYHGSYNFWSNDDNYDGRDDDGANRVPSIRGMGCLGEDDDEPVATQQLCDSIKIPVLLLGRSPAERLLETLKVAPKTTVDLMCEQVKHDYNAGAADGSGDAGEPEKIRRSPQNTLAEDTNAALANGENASEHGIWQIHNGTHAYSSYFSNDDDFYYDDDYVSIHIAQIGNVVVNSLSFLCMVPVVFILRPCQTVETASSLWHAVWLTVVSNVCFLLAAIFTAIDYEACYPNNWLYWIFTLLMVPLTIFGESKLLRAALARERGSGETNEAAPPYASVQEQPGYSLQGEPGYGQASQPNGIQITNLASGEGTYIDVEATTNKSGPF